MVDSGTRQSRQGRRQLQARHGSVLHCERCGLRYAEAAIAREATLLDGAHCRRCGGTLALDRTDSHIPDAPVLS